MKRSKVNVQAPFKADFKHMLKRTKDLPHGLRYDVEGNVLDLNGDVLEKCEECGEYCLPENVTREGLLCDDCFKQNAQVKAGSFPIFPN